MSNPTLRRGDNSPAVKTLQQALNARGYNCGQADGDFGNRTYLTLILFQQQNDLAPDGVAGRATWAKLLKEQGKPWHSVKATSFADPADVRAFKRCKAQGKTDNECFKVGDNGIGCWGDDTTGPTPMCALPREDWKPLGKAARGAKVEVEIKGKVVICELRDTMPSKKNIKNGAGIDLAPGACKAFGIKPPVDVPARWRFA